jgi:hypothetical protein
MDGSNAFYNNINNSIICGTLHLIPFNVTYALTHLMMVFCKSNICSAVYVIKAVALTDVSLNLKFVHLNPISVKSFLQLSSRCIRVLQIVSSVEVFEPKCCKLFHVIIPLIFSSFVYPNTLYLSTSISNARNLCS